MVSLNHCGGACAGNYINPNTGWATPTSNTWTTITNTDANTYSSNSSGVVTIKEAGVYRIQLEAMANPTVATAYESGGYYCPFINGSVNCLSDSNNSIRHEYTPASYWSAGSHEFTWSLAANTTVSW